MMYPNYQNQFNPYMNQVMTPNMSGKSNDIQYVNGFESAKAYPMTPNSTTILMDSTEPKFYLKRTDASGFSDLKTYVFSEYKETQPEEVFVKKTEFEQLKTELYNLSKVLEKTVKTQNKAVKGGADE